MKKGDQEIDPNRYKVSPRTLIFIFDNNDRVLMIKGGAQKKRWAGYFNAIGGHIEADEDILEAAQRELFEETGIKDAEIHFCGQIMISESNTAGVALFLFRGKYSQADLISSTEGELHWLTLNQTNDLPVVEDLRIIMPLVYAYRPGDPMIIGKYIFDGEGKLKVSLQR